MPDGRRLPRGGFAGKMSPGRGGMLESLLAAPKLPFPHRCSQTPPDTRVWRWALSAMPWMPRCALGWHGSTPAAASPRNGESHPTQQTPAVPQSLVSSPPITQCPPEHLQRCSDPSMWWLWDREDKYDPSVTLLHPTSSFAPAGSCLASHIPPQHPSHLTLHCPVVKQLGWSTCSPRIRPNPVPSQGLHSSSCEMGQQFPPVSRDSRRRQTCP